MIPQDFIQEWKNTAPWQDNAQVEQDLILSRALVDIFNHPLLAENLVFRGGTALHKLYSQPQERYSEDLDFAQKTTHPIGAILQALHSVLDPWAGQPKWKQTHGRVTLSYRYLSEISPSQNMRVKIEINTREHFHFSDLVRIPFEVHSRWYEGKANILSYALEELLGTKLRALYQRKKGRDLFDIAIVLKMFPNLNCQKVVDCFLFYLEKESLHITRAEFERNMNQKLMDNLFTQDIVPLLRPQKTYNHIVAYELAFQKIISLLP